MSVHVCDVNEQALTQITDDNPAVTATVCDVSNRASVESFVKEAVDTLGGIDVLINNAGISGPTKSVEDMDPDQWDAAVGVAESSAQRGHDDGHRWPRTPWQSQVRYLLHPL